MEQRVLFVLSVVLGACLCGCAALAGGKPDLFVSTVSVTPQSLAVKQPAKIRVGVYNRGAVPSGSFRVEWRPSGEESPPGCFWEVADLQPGDGATLMCSFPGFSEPFVKRMTIAIVDPENSVAESDEENNSRNLVVEVRGQPRRPDLMITEFTLAPFRPVEGRTVTVRVGVYNDGRAPAGPFTVTWVPGQHFRQPGCTWQVKGLRPKTGEILSCRYAGYPGAAQRMRAVVMVDSAHEVEESNEANNIHRKTVRVVKP